MKTVITALIVFFVLTVIVAVSVLNRKETKPWIPALKETTFHYLDDRVVKASELTNNLLINAKGNSLIRSDAEAIAGILTELHAYYIPLTEVRELVYDSDRCYFLGKIGLANDKLSSARKLVLKMVRKETPGVNKTLEGLIMMLDNQIVALRDSSTAVSYNFKELGNRVNLMLLKGELILSDNHFDTTFHKK